MMDKLRLYFHIPFCKSRCQYCDFHTFDDKDYLIDSYFKALLTEISLYNNEISNRKIDSIFFGGGTPSYPNHKYIEKVLSYFDIDDDMEVTIEANPGTVNYDKLKAYREMGINRVSFGVQSFNDNILLIMGRVHNKETAIKNIEEARRAGFNNINIDLIHGYPFQTMDIFKDTIDVVLELMPEHVSCYSLSIEEDTSLKSMIDRDIFQKPSQELDRQMYAYAIDKLGSHGINQYEISNFAMKGYECKHNAGYWILDDYIGFGAGAHSYFNKRRFSNKKVMGEYIRDLNSYVKPIEEDQEIAIDESMSEYVILGLRLNAGVDIDKFNEKYDRKFLDVYGQELDESIKSGLIEKQGSCIRLTDNGRNFANRVFVKFLKY